MEEKNGVCSTVQNPTKINSCTTQLREICTGPFIRIRTDKSTQYLAYKRHHWAMFVSRKVVQKKSPNFILLFLEPKSNVEVDPFSLGPTHINKVLGFFVLFTQI